MNSHDGVVFGKHDAFLHPSTLSRYINPENEGNDPDDVLLHPAIPPRLATIIHKAEINATKQRVRIYTDHCSTRQQFDSVSLLLFRGFRKANKDLGFIMTIHSSQMRNDLFVQERDRDDEGYWSDEPDDAPLAESPTKLLDAITAIRVIPSTLYPGGKDFRIILKKNYPRPTVHKLFAEIEGFAEDIVYQFRHRLHDWKLMRGQQYWPPFYSPDPE